MIQRDTGFFTDQIPTIKGDNERFLPKVIDYVYDSGNSGPTDMTGSERWEFEGTIRSTYPKFNTLDYEDLYDDYYFNDIELIDGGKIIIAYMVLDSNEYQKFITVVDDMTKEGFRPVYKVNIDDVISYYRMNRMVTNGKRTKVEFIKIKHQKSEQMPLFNWFFPSKDELNAIYVNLRAEGVGGFVNVNYWSSTESNSDGAWKQYFDDGSQLSSLKVYYWYVRACHSFIASEGAYSLRDTGPAGGLIFHIDGTTYYEAAPSTQSTGKFWSNIDDVLIGTTSAAIGEGQNNTDEIIAQDGHTDSAAKLCDDLVV
ncbi:hypothetical protein ES703_123545 [subsurface metagenome]